MAEANKSQKKRDRYEWIDMVRYPRSVKVPLTSVEYDFIYVKKVFTYTYAYIPIYIHSVRLGI